MEVREDYSLKLILKQNWDIPVNLPNIGEKPRGHFAGRRHELDSLVNELERRSNGSILVSGHRGAGKTSLVHRALNIAREKDSKLLPILVNTGHLRGDEDQSAARDGRNKPGVSPRALIEAIVRRLYSVTKLAARASEGEKFPAELLAPIESLYRKCVAAEFNLVETLASKNEQSGERTEEETSEHTVNVGRLAAYLPHLCWAAAGMTAVAPLIPSAPARGLVILGIAGAPYAWKVLRKTTTSKKVSVSSDVSAEELYKFDAKIGNLEFDLEAIHRQVQEKGWKLVYVIDELDKVEDHDVKAVIEVCKNLFTLSDAIFIFMGDEKLYDWSQPADKGVYQRGREYTYFNSRYFVAPPTTLELEGFVDEIVESKAEKVDDTFESLKHCLIFEARNDFFDLLTAIRGRINGFENGKPVIKIDRSGLDDDDVLKSRLSICIAALYEGKYMSTAATKWAQNKMLLSRIFHDALLLTKVPPAKEMDNPVGPSLDDSLVRDFHRLLQKLGALSDPRPRSQYQHNQDNQVTFHSFLGSIPGKPSRQLDILAEFELELRDECRSYFKMLIGLANIWLRRSNRTLLLERDFEDNAELVLTRFKEWDFNLSQNYEKLLSALLRYTRELPPFPETQKEVNQLSQRARDEVRDLVAMLPMTLGSMILRAFPAYDLKLLTFNGQTEFLNGDSTALREALHGKQIIVVQNQDRSKQIILISGPTTPLRLLGDDLEKITHQCPIIAVISQRDDAAPKHVHGIEAWDGKSLESSGTKVLRAIEKYFAAPLTVDSDK